MEIYAKFHQLNPIFVCFFFYMWKLNEVIRFSRLDSIQVREALWSRYQPAKLVAPRMGMEKKRHKITQQSELAKPAHV